MTQNKKFKKLVRARMAETGETYVQARNALHDGRKPFMDWPLYRPVGWWRAPRDEPGATECPNPFDLVDASWDASERATVVGYLRGGRPIGEFAGERCLLGCGSPVDPGMLGERRVFFHGPHTADESLSVEERRQARHVASQRTEEANLGSRHDKVELGARVLSDGKYAWPEGLDHYVEKHNVRLPAAFVEHVLREGLPEVPDKHPPEEMVYDFAWWYRATTSRLLETPDVERTKIALHRMWHEVYDTWTVEFHLYEDGPEDGRVHNSLCQRAKTKTFETKTPGRRLCEDCKLLKVRAILERQKKIGDPLNILHDPELWAAAGGDEEVE